MAKAYEKGFTQIPNWVLVHDDLGRVDIAVYAYLAYHADAKTRTCWPSHKLLMAETRITNKRALINSLERLEVAGAVVVLREKGYANRYYLPRVPKSREE